jgi:histone deacetylase complex regulatory component SIN3
MLFNGRMIPLIKDTNNDFVASGVLANASQNSNAHTVRITYPAGTLPANPTWNSDCSPSP